ncbi:hypothetical protein TGPRC2_278522 [Toxoplasma gondii TgCatPRC2]|uniref:Uncharacterized protein n=4 Tax=Toxoplasma gondii TaxID=5811 RepID=A0A125YPE5_TOXGV|nr:hypothetical protein TGME49_278522 [Toxoplasma gondii ME49]EPT25311.1 hypothetical protein TGME49_278522 [Toxoplasma gondii ME49]ESS34617.1 hypothetical protein TGVEG_278522 [Toxoplasma gondii VEG]KYK65298.1 hypothetical protein TGPRC2_278522 [Toxoplasma gondii TgCatPRC2]PIL97262.1 hypothetical protein TGCOUG_278522 [Toxoplasma gondii COUG]|eukprot:XP_018635130.1 hypothetical protein TGME49_278522 [Toxoplasma gondii ME49]
MLYRHSAKFYKIPTEMFAGATDSMKIMKDGVMYDAEKCFHDPNQWYRDVKDIGPQNKYLHPATASQEVGWRTNESLEKFGVNHYGYKKKTADIQPARLKNAQPNASGL